MKTKKFCQPGFTLIELMVVVTIIIILSGVSLASYFRFSQRQAVLNDARNLVVEMRRVQALARNLVYPDDTCTGLTEYKLVSEDEEDCVDCTLMSANAVCNSVNFPIFSNEMVMTKKRVEGINMTFAAGTGSITPTGTYNLYDPDDLDKIQVKTDESGNIDINEL